MNKVQQIKVIDNYEMQMHNQIGRGSFGNVYIGTDKRSNRKVAIKMINSSIIRNPKTREQLLNEIQLMSKINHPNVVQLFEVIETVNNIYLILEMCDEGDLESILYQQKNISDQQIQKFFYDIIQGYAELIKHNIIHRDLKLANILVKNDVFKIADFGFASLNGIQNKMNSGLVGSPIYMSPQVLDRQSYSNKNDVWSFGIMIYELLYGNTPWLGKNQQQLLQNILNTPLYFPKHRLISQEFQNLLTQMLQKDEQKRISWSELVEFSQQIQFNQNHITQQIHTSQEQQNPINQINYQQQNSQQFQQINQVQTKSKQFQKYL